MSETNNITLQDIVAHCKAYGFVFPSSEIYGQLQAVYDYGPYGVLLKEKVQRFWTQAMRRGNVKIVDLDTAVFMHSYCWEASGHLEHFEDLFVDNKDSKKRYRVDTLIEDQIDKLKSTSSLTLLQKKYKLAQQISNSSEKQKALQMLLKGISCPISGTDNWGNVRRLQLMFSTEAGASTEDTMTLYLRPETAQGIYVNFLNVQKSLRLKLPFGIAQTGKAFRNELIARQFLFRSREFTQMEMQFFISSESRKKWFEYWQQQRLQWYKAIGIPSKKLRLRPHTQLAHYAQAATDIEYYFPFGWKEIEGIHARGNFDLSQHAKTSGKRLDYFDSEANHHHLPEVIETSAGLDRICLMLLCEAYNHIQEGEKKRLCLSFPSAFSPLQVAVFPLLRKEALCSYARKLADELRQDFEVAYEEASSIGKRYTRQDLIGTPFCVTIDYQTLEDDSVTLRLRDSSEQLRMPSKEVASYLRTHCSFRSLLSKLRQSI